MQAPGTRASDHAAKPRRFDLADLKQRAVPYLEAIGIGEMGKPSEQSKTAIKWGTHGSLVLNLAGRFCGEFHSWETGEHGDIIAFVARARNVSIGEAIRIVSEYVGGSPQSVPTIRTVSKVSDSGANTAVALCKWRATKPIKGTLGEIYYGQHRKLDVVGRLDVDHALRWDPNTQAIIALMTDPKTGEPTGIHRTFLGPDGTKRDRKMLGRQGVVRLSPDESVTTSLGISEGVEDGLAVLLSGWRPIWAATSSGAVTSFPVLPAIETLTVFADADDAGLPAAEACRARWREAGREVAIVAPRMSTS